MTSVSRTTAADAAGRDARRADDQRHAQHALVDEDAVIALAVLAERLAVIAGDDDDRPIQQAPAVERLEQPADLRVGKRDFADVRIAAYRRAERFGRIVRTVRVVEVRPQEEW